MPPSKPVRSVASSKRQRSKSSDSGSEAATVVDGGSEAPSPPSERSVRRQALRRRLARVEGQVRGLGRMVDEDRYCVDILTQLAAVHQALRQVGRELLADHMSHCVAEAMTSDDPEERNRVSDEIAQLMFKYSR